MRNSYAFIEKAIKGHVTKPVDVNSVIAYTIEELADMWDRCVSDFSSECARLVENTDDTSSLENEALEEFRELFEDKLSEASWVKNESVIKAISDSVGHCFACNVSEVADRLVNGGW